MASIGAVYARRHVSIGGAKCVFRWKTIIGGNHIYRDVFRVSVAAASENIDGLPCWRIMALAELADDEAVLVFVGDKDKLAGVEGRRFLCFRRGRLRYLDCFFGIIVANYFWRR